VYDNLSPEANEKEYYLNKINGISKLVTLSRFTADTPDNAAYSFLVSPPLPPPPKIDLADYEGITDPGNRTGLAAFEEREDISIVCIPDENEDNIDEGKRLRSALTSHCEKMNRFAILQASQSAGPVGNLYPQEDSKYAAFYYPWITIIDPVTNINKLIPPGGHIAGVYARSDSERGVHKAPANEVLRGAVDLQINLTKGEQDVLNPRGVNCIRTFVGRGIRIWGARTCSTDTSWKYVNVRRLFIFLEKSIERGTQWVVFEPNDEKLWARVKQTINQFLTTVWRSGALMGSTQDEAFFVRCDRTTMTQDDIDNGRLIIMVGIAPVKPAEFVIFRIAQVAKGSEISE
jgi:phage tail sheath protein FI